MFSVRELRAFKALDNPTFDYGISSVSDEESWKRTDTNLLEELLNTNLPLSRYGALAEFGFIPVMLASDDREQFIIYNVDAREISISLRADHAAIRDAASPEEGTAVLARLLLTAIPLLARVPVPDFRITAFYHDFKAILESRGWLDGPVPNPEDYPLFLVWSDNYHPDHPEQTPGLSARRIAVRECFDLISPAPVIDLLNTRLSPADFGHSLSGVYLTFQADEPEPDIRRMHLVPTELNSGGISPPLFPLSFVARRSQSSGYSPSSRLAQRENSLPKFSPYLIPQTLEYFPSDRELHLTLPLGARHLLGMSRQDIVRLMARALLSAEPLVAKETIPDFDVDLFFRRVEHVFKTERLVI